MFYMHSSEAAGSALIKYHPGGGIRLACRQAIARAGRQAGQAGWGLGWDRTGCLISGFLARESATRLGSLLQGHYVRCDSHLFLLQGFPYWVGDAGTRDCWGSWGCGGCFRSWPW